MWQKCPICNGTGKIYSNLFSLNFESCLTCNGTRIISELSGLPPNYEQNEIERQKANILNKIPDNFKNYSSTDFKDEYI